MSALREAAVLLEKALTDVLADVPPHVEQDCVDLRLTGAELNAIQAARAAVARAMTQESR